MSSYRPTFRESLAWVAAGHALAFMPDHPDRGIQVTRLVLAFACSLTGLYCLFRWTTSHED